MLLDLLVLPNNTCEREFLIEDRITDGMIPNAQSVIDYANSVGKKVIILGELSNVTPGMMNVCNRH